MEARREEEAAKAIQQKDEDTQRLQAEARHKRRQALAASKEARRCAEAAAVKEREQAEALSWAAAVARRKVQEREIRAMTLEEQAVREETARRNAYASKLETQQLKQLVSELDKLKAKEDAVVTNVCAKQTKVPADQCEAMVKQSFEKILEKECPSELEAFPAFPSPLCDKLKENEDAVVSGICSKQTKVPNDQCVAKVKEGLAKMISTQCPGHVEASPLPANLCDDMKDKESDFVSGMCAEQHLVPVMTCETNAKQSFDMLLAKVCPSEVIVV